MVEYVFREPLVIKNGRNLEAESVAKAIQAVSASDDMADALWRAARDRKHYLHGCFEWDTRKAAEAHWRDTALRIIRCVVEIETHTPMYVSMTTGKDGGNRHHVATSDILTSAHLQLRLMQMAASDLHSFLKRYTTLRVITPLIETAVDNLDAEIIAATQKIRRSTDPPEMADAA